MRWPALLFALALASLTGAQAASTSRPSVTQSAVAVDSHGAHTAVLLPGAVALLTSHGRIAVEMSEVAVIEAHKAGQVQVTWLNGDRLTGIPSETLLGENQEAIYVGQPPPPPIDPLEVAAWVNGRPVSLQDWRYKSSRVGASEQDPFSKLDALEAAIDFELLAQEAEARGFADHYSTRRGMAARLERQLLQDGSHYPELNQEMARARYEGNPQAYTIPEKKRIHTVKLRIGADLSVEEAFEACSYGRERLRKRPPERQWTPGLRSMNPESEDPVLQAAEELGPMETRCVLDGDAVVLVQVLEVQPARLMGFEEASRMIFSQLRLEAAEQALETVLEELHGQATIERQTNLVLNTELVPGTRFPVGEY